MTRAATLIITMITFFAGVASLTAALCSVTSPPCGSVIYAPPPPTSVFLIEVSDAVDPATVDASDFTLNGIPADAVMLLNNNTWIQFIFNTSPEVPGINTMHIPGGAFNCVSNGPVLEFTCTFRWRPIPLRPRPSPAPRP